MVKERKLPDILTMEERKEFLGIFNTRYHAGRKNRLMVELMLTVGLRISEICSLQWEHIKWTDALLMVKKYAEKVGIEKNVYNHLLRHTTLTDLYIDTKDIRKVQQIAGHASIQATQIYTHISPEEIRESLTKEKYYPKAES